MGVVGSVGVVGCVLSIVCWWCVVSCVGVVGCVYCWFCMILVVYVVGCGPGGWALYCRLPPYMLTPNEMCIPYSGY